MNEPKKLTRHVGQAKVGGVCAGLATYLNVDVTVVRVVTALLIIFTFPVALIAYLAMWLLTPTDQPAVPTAYTTRPPGAP